MKFAIPKHIRSLEPYTPGRPIEEIKRKYGIDEVIKLASNENALGPSPKAILAIKEALPYLHRYPSSSGWELCKRLAEKLSIKPEQIVLGNGSDEIMGLVGHVFLSPNDEVIIPSPSFSIYEKVACLYHAKVVKVPLSEFKIDLDEISKKINSKTKLIFINNPHNPTGTIFTVYEWENFLEKVPPFVIIVLDEAYIDFVEDSRKINSLNYLKDFKNLIVLRTFSKSHGLAGLRIGYGILDAPLAHYLQLVRDPFSVNSLAQIGALAALDDEGFLEKTRKTIWEGKAYLMNEFRKLGIMTIPSEANFLLIYLADKADYICNELLSRGIIVRSMKSYGMEEYLRITIGRPEENEKLISNLKQIWAKV